MEHDRIQTPTLEIKTIVSVGNPCRVLRLNGNDDHRVKSSLDDGRREKEKEKKEEHYGHKGSFPWLDKRNVRLEFYATSARIQRHEKGNRVKEGERWCLTEKTARGGREVLWKHRNNRGANKSPSRMERTPTKELRFSGEHAWQIPWKTCPSFLPYVRRRGHKRWKRPTLGSFCCSSIKFPCQKFLQLNFDGAMLKNRVGQCHVARYCFLCDLVGFLNCSELLLLQ